MDIELVVWGIIPLLIGLIEIYFSIRLYFKQKSVPQLLLSILICLINGFSALIIIEMAFGAYPTFLPHIGIAISTIIIIIQILISKKRKATPPKLH